MILLLPSTIQLRKGNKHTRKISKVAHKKMNITLQILQSSNSSKDMKKCLLNPQNKSKMQKKTKK